MTNELFVDGICEIDDQTIESYFSRFGSRIIHYDSHRHRPTNSCCFALILFESSDTIHTILRRRPHKIHHYSLFVKRLLPPNSCSFIERLLPVSSLFVRTKSIQECDDQQLKDYFNTFGRILKFERDHNHDRLLIEFDDYDSVDRIFLNKDHLPQSLDIHKNILPRAQSRIEYHGTCRRKQQEISIDEKKKTKRRHRKNRVPIDDQYQDLLHKTIEDLIHCKAQLRNKETDYVLLQMEYMTIKEENEKIHQKSCPMCEEHQTTIIRLQQALSNVNDQYETIKSQYQRVISTQHIPTKLEDQIPITTNSIPCHHSSFSTRLNQNYFSQFNLPPTPASLDSGKHQSGSSRFTSPR